jgi:hypothetical protein
MVVAVSQRSYARGADRHNVLIHERGLRMPRPLPHRRELDVRCACGHHAMIKIDRHAVPMIRCSKCGASGLVTEFLLPRGLRAKEEQRASGMSERKAAKVLGVHEATLRYHLREIHAGNAQKSRTGDQRDRRLPAGRGCARRVDR